ncbi:MAG: diaminopimelate epimerase [Pseudomonadota bacterium]
MDIDFLKMHGLGNDFVVLDCRTQPLELTQQALQKIANRRTGVGCDQILVLENGKDAFLRIYNANGGEAEACGNGTRCVAWWLGKQLGRDQLTLQTIAGDLSCHITKSDHVQVEMGQVEVLSSESPGSIDVKLGNPHKIYFVSDCNQVNWQELRDQAGKAVNIGVVQIVHPKLIHLKVWERGVGFTQACGSGACAAVAAARVQKLVDAECQVQQPGGLLEVEVDESGMVKMTGPAVLSYQGVFNLNALVS